MKTITEMTNWRGLLRMEFVLVFLEGMMDYLIEDDIKVFESNERSIF